MESEKEMTQLKRVPFPKVEFDDPTALLVPKGHRFERAEDPHISNRVVCSDCEMEGWLRCSHGQNAVAAYKQDIKPCLTN